MHTVNKNNIVFIYLLQNCNIKTNTSQSNLYKSPYSQTQARSQRTAMGGGGGGGRGSVLEVCFEVLFMDFVENRKQEGDVSVANHK